MGEGLVNEKLLTEEQQKRRELAEAILEGQIDDIFTTIIAQVRVVIQSIINSVPYLLITQKGLLENDISSVLEAWSEKKLSQREKDLVDRLADASREAEEEQEGGTHLAIQPPSESLISDFEEIIGEILERVFGISISSLEPNHQREFEVRIREIVQSLARR